MSYGNISIKITKLTSIMWKYVLTQFKNLPLLIGLVGFISSQLLAQPPLVANQLTASSKTRHVQEPTQTRDLKTVLNDVANRLKISLSYDSETVKGKKVDANVLDELNKLQDAETSLRVLLTPFQLSYEKLAENYFIILKNRKKAKIQKIEKKGNFEIITPQKVEGKLPQQVVPEILEKNNVATETTRAISGTVKDNKGEPIPGVAVLVQNTLIGTTTDAEGKYNLNVPEGNNILIFSSVGYITQEVNIDAKAIIDVVLQDNVANLQEIVVIGYGTVQKSDLTGSVSSIKSDEIVKIPSFNPLQALQGKIAGVQVSSGSGAPGEAPVVRIRGTGTFNNASPLYVVDGVFVDDISFISPADIESMEVLKDASSTAIYGARGANGVILITTRRGSEGKTRIAVNGRFSQQIIPQKIDMLSGREFAQVVNEFAPGTFNNIDLVANTDWQNEIFSTPAPITDFDVSFSGGTSNTSYYVGIGYFNQKGVIPKSSYDRLNLKLNNQYTIHKNLKFGHDITISRYTRKNAPNVVATAYRAWPTDTPYNTNGQFAEVRKVGNPLADIEYTNNRSVGVRAAGSLYADLKILKDFTFRSSFGFDGDLSKSKSFTPVFFVSPNQSNPINGLFTGTNQSFRWVWENTLSYFKKINNHQIDAIVGYTMQENRGEFLNVGAQNLIREYEDVWYVDAADTQNGLRAGNNAFEEGLISYLFRTNYSFKGKYLFSITGRIDGSSKFGRNNRYGFFPSVALGWNISQESFMQSFTMIDNLKLRGSYGVLGNEKIPGNAQYALVRSGFNGVFGNNIQQGATLDGLGNPDLRWESTAMLDIGLEIGLFKNRLTAEFDYFRRITDDILIPVRVPAHIGLGVGVRAIRNAAKVVNSGLEFNINWNDQIGEVKYQIGVLGNTLRNQVINLGSSGGDPIFDSFLGQTLTITQPAQPIGAYYGYQAIGVFQTLEELNQSPRLSDQGVGDLKFADLDGNGVLNSADRTIIGSPIPSFIYGFNLGGSYKQFGFSLDFQGQLGNEIYNAKQGARPEIFNFEGRVRNRWAGNGTSNSEPRATSGGSNYLPSTYFIESGSFLRLRNVTIYYNLPSALMNKLKISNAKVYLSGTNVFTLTNFSGYSPEIGGASPTFTGIDTGIYPITAVYSLGFNLNF
jgi:TonB-linked SusC/RagA family outer membrane protein